MRPGWPSSPMAIIIWRWKNASPLLWRPEVRRALSNSKAEAASHRVYRDTVFDLAEAEGQDVERHRQQLDDNALIASRMIHHRDTYDRMRRIAGL